MKDKVKRELLFSVTRKDLEITYYSGTGAGGQHRNRHMNCVRMKHPDSGTMVTASDSKSKDRNLRTAFNRLVNHEQFKKWHRIKSAELMMDAEERKRQIEEWVEEQMNPENLRIETYEPTDS